MTIETRNDSVITFIKNHDTGSASFTGEEIVFSMPYSKILEAAQFCEREFLDSIFVGLKNNEWQLEISDKDFEYSVLVTPNGISQETELEYVYFIKKFTISE